MLIDSVGANPFPDFLVDEEQGTFLEMEEVYHLLD